MKDTTKPEGRAKRLKLGAREIEVQGLDRPILQDLYHYFMTASWPKVFASIALFLLAVDVVFALLFLLQPGSIANQNPPGFAGAFFFSVETLATVGYGDMHPATAYGHIVSTLEIFVGLMTLALVTGIMFARFSRPTARFLFAKFGVVRPLDGQLTLMFRAANARQNVVQEASAQLRLLRDETTLEGYRIRRIIDLPLVRAQHPVFLLGWNIMHVIDDKSPLRHETEETLRRSAATFILSLSGTDETTGQLLMTRHDYAASDLRWNHTFIDILHTADDGRLQFNYRKFHDVEKLS